MSYVADSVDFNDKSLPLTDDDRRYLNTVRLNYRNLMDEITLFEDELRQHASLLHAEVYQLPSFTDDDIGQQPESIEVQAITGEPAFSLALSHLHSFNLDYDHSGRIIKRLPGLLAVEHRDPFSLMKRLVNVNAKKAELHAEIKKCPNNDMRFIMLTQAIPNVVKLKAFRDLLFANRPLYSVGFSWKHRQSIQRMGKSALLAMLNVSLNYHQTRFPLSEKTEQIKRDIDAISRYPSTSAFIQCRSLRVAPAMNLRYVKDTPVFISGLKAPVDMIAHSPLLVVNHYPKLHPLKAYLIDNAGINTQPYGEPVIPRLGIYFDAKRSTVQI